MEAVIKALRTAPLELLLFIAFLISDLGSSVLKSREERILKVPHKRVEIFMAPREMHMTITEISKCEVNALQSG
jgi:hypothetical protein